MQSNYSAIMRHAETTHLEPTADELGEELSPEFIHPVIRALHAGLRPSALNPRFNAAGEIDGVSVSARDVPYRGLAPNGGLQENIPLAEIPLPVEYEPIIVDISERYDELKDRVEKITAHLNATIMQNDADLTMWLQNNPNDTEKIGPAETALRQLSLLKHDVEKTLARLTLQTNNLLFTLYDAACRSTIVNELRLRSITEEARAAFQTITDDLNTLESYIHSQTWRAYPPIIAEK